VVHGTIQAVTAENDVAGAAGLRRAVTRSVDPTSTFNVLRLKRDLGDNASVAVMLTATTHAESTANYPLVQPGQGYGFPTSASVLCPGPVELTQVITNRCRCGRWGGVSTMHTSARSTGAGARRGDWVTGGRSCRPCSSAVRGSKRPTARRSIRATSASVEGVREQGGGEALDRQREHGSRVGEVRDQRSRVQPARQPARRGGNLEYRDLDPAGPFLETHEWLFVGGTLDVRGLLIGQGNYAGRMGASRTSGTTP